MTDSEPKLSVKLSITPSTYHFSNPTAPTLSLDIQSHADKTLTLFTWATPFAPALALNRRGFVITDVANNTTVPQTSVMVQRAPFSRARDSGDEKYFLTLEPHAPITVSAVFGRGGGMRPQPRAIVEKGWELDEQGNERKIRRSTQGCGVDGLESGHTYRVDVARDKLMGLWWRWGTKEEILVDHSSRDWNLSSLQQEQSPLEVEHIEGVEFSVEE